MRLRHSLAGAALAALLAAAPCLAQEPPKEYTLKLTPQELVTIGNALQERPYKEVNGLLIKMQGQITQQATPPPPPAPAPPPEKPEAVEPPK